MGEFITTPSRQLERLVVICRLAFNRVFLTLCGGGICGGETLDVVRAEENFCEVAVRQRSDQPIKDGHASALWQNWPEACSENACYRSIDGVTTQSEKDPVKVGRQPNRVKLSCPAWPGW